ncbi:type I restriction enzyme, S subunit [Bizionia echini]|uniref:Type I restriction enzyme, S subunit n=1 Tax=Bizionia echini TaxID=649333 RepID=A0A1I5AFP2_9FLAO|nr:restriction endonuclease subunit S [Bizionia echini]SFN61273.1 type I restriction enzyme, S subunit [Bizionia echini]
MREGWKKAKIGDYCKVLSSKRVFANDYVKKGIPFYRSKEIIHKALNQFTGDEIYISEKKFNDFKSKFGAPIKGDILLSSVGNRSGIAYLVREDYDFYFKDGNLIWMKDFSNELSSEYLEYYLRSELGQKTIESMMIGAAQKALTIDGVKRIKINLPPLKTQRKIASMLSAYDDLIENNLKRIKLLEEQAQLTYTEWFVRFKFPGYENTDFDEVSGLPVGWEKVKLVECANLVMGQSPKSEFYNNEEIGLPFHQGVKDYGFRFPINYSWSTQGNRIAEEDSILFSVRAPVGRLNIAIEKLIIGRGLASINHKKGWNSFLLYQLQNIFYEDNLMGGGAIYNSVTKKDVERIKIIHASEEINIKFNDLATIIDKQIKNLTIQNQHLKEARDILLPRLMSGMIDVASASSATYNPLLELVEGNDSLGMVAEESDIYKKLN